MCLLAQRHGWDRKAHYRSNHSSRAPWTRPTRSELYFTRNGGDVGNARKLFKTIAIQLIRRSTALKHSILKAVDENSELSATVTSLTISPVNSS